MNDTSNLLQFIGRFHPVLVHLPIGFLALLVVLESLAFTRRFRDANACAAYVIALLVPVICFTAAAGWVLSFSGDYNIAILKAHQAFGIATMVLCLLAGLAYWLKRKRTYRAALFLSAAVLVVASHFGGSLTHGTDYLFPYALRPAEALIENAPTRPPQEIPEMRAEVFSMVVQPILKTRCGTCHGANKQKGGLRLDTLEGLRQGGDTGPVLTTGNPGKSLLLERILLPLEHDDHMPPAGKPQLTPEELVILRWYMSEWSAVRGPSPGEN